MKLLIQQGRLIDPKHPYAGTWDILIERDRIIKIAPQITPPENCERIDAAGFCVAPGLIDPHVHLRDPGLTYKEDIASGTAAAAAGGFTTVACMPNTKPVVDTPEIVQYILNKSKSDGSGVRVLPIGAVTVGQQGEMLTNFSALRQAGAVALSDDGVPIMNGALMREALKRADALGLTILCHEEDRKMVQNYAVNEGMISKQLGIPGRPAIAEELMVMRDGMLSLETGVPLHFCHISTAGSVEIIRRLRAYGAQVTAETCPQYFTLTEDAILERGTLARVNPPLRTRQDVEAIIAGLQDGTLDCIATDHAPHSAEEKAKPLTQAPSGMVGLETALALTLNKLYQEKHLSLEEIIAKMSWNPTKVLGLKWEGLTVGGRADLVLFDPEETWNIDPELFRSKGRNTPFGGKEVRGRVKVTVAEGTVVYRQEETGKDSSYVV